MRFALSFLFALFVLVGCVSTPPKPNPSVVEKQVVNSVLKELCAAVLNIQGGYIHGDPNLGREHLAANDGWIAAIETSLSTAEEASANPSATLVGPIIPGLLVPKGATAGSYNAAVGGTLDQTATVLRDNKHYLVVQSLLSDSELCPPKGTPAYDAYFNEDAPYRSDGKFLAGKLGIYDWLYNGMIAHNFGALIDPTTLVVQGPYVAEPPPLHAAGRMISKLSRSGAFSEQEFFGTHSTTTGCSGPDCPQPTVFPPPQVWTQGLPAPPISFAFEDPHNSPLTYTAVVEPNNAALPTWITLDTTRKTLTIGVVPSGVTFTSVRVIATNANKSYGWLDIPFTVASGVPKTTTWGPTYGATFTFLLKGSGQLGPSFTFDKSKGGAANLFSVTRTETNYVNIALTSVGVPLVENAQVNGVPTAQAQATVAALSNPDAINAAIERLETTLLKLNLSNVFASPP